MLVDTFETWDINILVWLDITVAVVFTNVLSVAFIWKMYGSDVVRDSTV
jgi:hypothetical protein